MSDATKSMTPDEDGALARRIAARRSTTEALAAETKPSGHDAPIAAPMDRSTVMSSSSSEDGLHDRIADRRAKRQGDADAGSAGSGEGESEGGSIGKHIAREPLFVGLGFPSKHGGALDGNAPPVKREREDLGAPDPQPERARKFKP